MQEVLHASSVALNGRGLLLLGASGTGKSSLALEFMARGAVLVADDRTCLSLRDGAVWMSAPPSIEGRIEARGIGILRADHAPARLHTVVDLDRTETERLPPQRHLTLLGVPCPLLHKSASPCFPAALMQYLLGGREE